MCDKNCEKIHYMAPNIYCCGAGTAADTEAVTGKSGLLFTLVMLLAVCVVAAHFCALLNVHL